MFSIVSVIMCGLLLSLTQVITRVEAETADEQAIFQVIKGIATAFNARDLEAQLAAYAPDAMIESLAVRGAPMSREQYAALRRTWTPRGTIYLRKVSVNVLSADEAEATVIFRLQDGDRDMLGRRALRFVRRAGQWLVVEARFVGPIPWDSK